MSVQPRILGDSEDDHPDAPIAPISPSGKRSPGRPQQRERYKEDDKARNCEQNAVMGALHIDRRELAFGSVVGEGLTAEVFEGKYQGETVAIKQFNIQKQRFTVRQEISLLRETQVAASVFHKNLVRCYGLAFDKQPFLVITEFCYGGTLFELLHESSLDIVLRQKLKMASDISAAMDYLHKYKPQIIHRDLKSLNLLLDQPVKSPTTVPYVKLSDFGFAKTKDEEDTEWQRMTAKVGTFHWMAPEVGSGNYNEKCDVYSFAMVLFEIVAQEVPYEDLDANEVLPHVKSGGRPSMDALPPDCPEGLKNLMVQCWLHAPHDRPSFDYICSLMDKMTARFLTQL